MGAHAIDGLHLKVALPAILTLAGLSFISVYDLPYCWTPAQFTAAMVAYTRNTCGNNLTKSINNGYSFPLVSIHLIAEASITLIVYLLSTHIASYSLPSASLVKIAWKGVISGTKVPPKMNNCIKNLLNSRSIAVLYFLTQVAALVCWIGAYIFAVQNSEMKSTIRKPYYMYDAIPIEKSEGHYVKSEAHHIFICDFAVRRLGNVQRYSVQCEPPSYDTLNFTIMANYTLCFLMAASTLVHLIHVFVVSPLMQKGNVSMLIQASDEAPVKLDFAYGFTNLHMITALCPKTMAAAKLVDAGDSKALQVQENNEKPSHMI